MTVLWIMDIEDVQYTMNRIKRPVCPLYKQIRTPSLQPLKYWSAGTNRCLISKLLTTFSKDHSLYSTIRNSPWFLRPNSEQYSREINKDKRVQCIDWRWPILSRTFSDELRIMHMCTWYMGLNSAGSRRIHGLWPKSVCRLQSILLHTASYTTVFP
jgi:hypothetical protein